MALPILQILFGSTVRLVAPLDPAACSARLQTITGAGASEGKKVYGRVDGQEVRWRRRHKYRNDLGTCLTADLAADPAGTVLTCRFGPGTGNWLFFVLVFGILALGLYGEFFLGWHVTIRTNDEVVTDPVQRQLTMLTFPFLMAGFFAFGRYLARNDQPFMLKLLKKTLGAQEAPMATMVKR
jgi:hypothetical protein